MIIKCENCGNKYRLDLKKIKDMKGGVKCSACGHQLVIHKPDRAPTTSKDGQTPSKEDDSSLNGKSSPPGQKGSETDHPEQTGQPPRAINLSDLERYLEPIDAWDPNREATEPSASVDLSQLNQYIDDSGGELKDDADRSSGRSARLFSGEQPADSVDTPTISPGSGKYNLTLRVSISCAAENSIIHYTLDGSDPTGRSPRYSGPVEVSSSTTIKARAFKPGWVTSEIAAETYEIVKKVVPPSFSILSGTYTSTQNLTISCDTPQADIRFTNDGSEPTLNSSLYQFPIGITKSVTITARTYKSGWQRSKIVKAIYEITGTVATPTFFVEPGAYPSPQMVNILCATPGAEIHYTTDENEPTKTMAAYKEPIEISKSTYLFARAFKKGWESSELVTGYYEITDKVETPAFSIKRGTYTTPQKVKISCPTSEARIHYTIDGTVPNTDSLLYSGPLKIKETTMLTARAFRDTWAPSDIAVTSYKITGTLSTPAFSVKPGKYIAAQQVVISCATPEAEIYYTIDGTYPAENSIPYTQPVHLKKSAVIKARALLTDWEPSEVAEAKYHITGRVASP
ncbi:MAG: zinc-ribbon domain-containing protein, partial [Deltaproteobacteria bacterium]|nr:zinc-ribbon domain-containing protein [Deltaproteobacteria bacterium]